MLSPFHVLIGHPQSFSRDAHCISHLTNACTLPVWCTECVHVSIFDLAVLSSLHPPPFRGAASPSLHLSPTRWHLSVPLFCPTYLCGGGHGPRAELPRRLDTRAGKPEAPRQSSVWWGAPGGSAAGVGVNSLPAEGSSHDRQLESSARTHGPIGTLPTHNGDCSLGWGSHPRPVWLCVGFLNL